MPRYDDVDSYYDDRYDYDNLVRDCNDLYTCDEESFDDDNNNETEWENYYHNIADELIEE